jgi:transposase-like protein
MKYSKRIQDKIFKLLSTDDYTVEEICTNVGINPDTYYTWKKERSEFSEMLQKANDVRMEFFKTEARRSMAKKIRGYDYEEVHTTVVDKDGTPKIKEQKKVKKHVPPDTAALIFTLTNTDPDNFKNSQFIDHKIDIDKEKSRVASLFPNEEEFNEANNNTNQQEEKQ